jgi:hypothetical protein
MTPCHQKELKELPCVVLLCFLTFLCLLFVSLFTSGCQNTATVPPLAPGASGSPAPYVIGWDNATNEEEFAPQCHQMYADWLKEYGEALFPGRTIDPNAGWTQKPWGWDVDYDAGLIFDRLNKHATATAKP